MFNDGVGGPFLANGFYVGIAGPGCKVQFDELASANVIYATKAKPFQRMVDGLSLLVQDAAFQCHENAGFHIGRFPEMSCSRPPYAGRRRGARCILFKCRSLWLQPRWDRSEEQKSELQALMCISYAVLCLKK